eukprot:3218064-Pyramimonas_sp.AAC.1
MRLGVHWERFGACRKRRGALGSAWKRLGALGSAWEHLGAPESAWERLGRAPAERAPHTVFSYGLRLHGRPKGRRML